MLDYTCRISATPLVHDVGPVRIADPAVPLRDLVQRLAVGVLGVLLTLMLQWHLRFATLILLHCHMTPP